MEAVLSWATVAGYREGDNPAAWRGNPQELLPAPGKIAKATERWRSLTPRAGGSQYRRAKALPHERCSLPR